MKVLRLGTLGRDLAGTSLDVLLETIALKQCGHSVLDKCGVGAFVNSPVTSPILRCNHLGKGCGPAALMAHHNGVGTTDPLLAEPTAPEGLGRPPCYRRL